MSANEPVSYQVFNEIGIIDQLASHAFTQCLPRDMTIAQFGILNHFVRLGHEFSTPAQLASAFQVSRPTMSNTLARLERSGLVTIVPAPDDGRAKHVSITGAGRAMRDMCIQRLAEPLAELDREVPPEVFAQLLPLLTKLRTILDAMRD